MNAVTLTSENIFHYLRKRALINEQEVVKGNYRVVPVKTRNNIMKVELVPGHSLFVKQLGNDHLADTLFKRETAAYQLFNRYPETFSASSSIPALLHHDEENNVLVTALLDDAQSVYEHYMYGRRFDPSLARGQASILAAYHQVTFGENDLRSFPRLLPWVLQLDRYQAHEFFVNNEFSAKMIGVIKTDPLLQNSLIELAKGWKHTHLIHGDVKWINFLVKQNEEGSIQKLIDWELADIGDPLWDVAGLLQSYIVTWLFGFDNNQPDRHQFPQQMEAFHLRHMQPSAQAFLDQYMNILKCPPQARAAFLHKVMQYTAARIVQTCTEGVTYHTKIEANNMRGLQLAHNIFKDPAYAFKELLNIDIHDVR